MSAPVLSPTPENIARAADILRSGGLVVVPTETVYGLACDAGNAEAVARLYAAKGRPSFNPLIAHVTGLEAAQRLADLPPLALSLARQFWPGPLTLVAPRRAGNTGLCDLACAGLNTVAIRQPDHPVAAALLAAFGGALVAPSANPSGRISPTCAAHVADDMGDVVDLILDGGACAVGLESTIVGFQDDAPVLLRLGGLDTRAIEDFLKRPLLRTGSDPDAPTSPGQLLRHYAPRAALRLNADAPQENEAYLGFGTGACTANLSAKGDLVEAAANLFTLLRLLDETHAAIAVAPVPMTGLGAAINDRLTRAAERG